MLQLLGTALECSSLALPLASAKPPSPPHSTDTPPHAKATNHGIDVYTLYQDLYQGLSNLESIWLQTVNSNKPLNDDIAAVKELGAICDRLLVAIRPCVPEDASPHESWQRFKLALKSSRKNTELARLKDRLLELQKTLTIDVSKVMKQVCHRFYSSVGLLTVGFLVIGLSIQNTKSVNCSSKQND